MEQETNSQERPKRRIKKNTWTGLFFLLIGGVWLLKQFGYPIPYWLFSWEMMLIVIGLFIGIQHKFRDLSWFILIAIGFVFLSDDIWPGISLRHYVMPVVVIALGFLFLFSPKRLSRSRRCGRDRGRFNRGRNFDYDDNDSEEINDMTMDIVSVFGGVKKSVLSKNFKGGEVVCIFGGAEINLTNADFIGPVAIDVVQIFGGTKLIVPSNWEIRSEIAAVFGGIDDKRRPPGNVPPEKTLILKGTSVFAGIEIISF